MSATFRQILELINQGEIRISAHGYDELVDDDIFIRDVMSTVTKAIIVEDYPE